MTRFAGLDGSVRETSVRVVDEAGKVLAERKVATEPDDLIELLQSISSEYGRIGLEAGPLSQWCQWRFKAPHFGRSKIPHFGRSKTPQSPVGGEARSPQVAQSLAAW